MKIRQALSSCRLASLCVLLLASPGSVTAAAAARKANGDAAGHAAAHAHAHLGSFASDLNECVAQVDICLDNLECLECMTSYIDHPFEYDDCMVSYKADGASATACDVKAAQPCCFDLVSQGTCLENDYFLDYWGCWFETFAECPGHELTCTGSADTSSEISDSSTSVDKLVEETASEGSGAAAGRGMRPTRTLFVAAASSFAGVIAAGALLVL
eukprot:g15944.t1